LGYRQDTYDILSLFILFTQLFFSEPLNSGVPHIRL
jgi:hypothetical protein